MPQVDVEVLARAFVNLREAMAENTREYEAKQKELKGKQKKIGGVVLGFLAEHGIESVNTKSGTFYRQEEVTPTAADWQKIYAWIVETDSFDALEKRIKKTFIRQYLDENKGAIPPGMNVFREYVVHCTRRGKQTQDQE